MQRIVVVGAGAIGGVLAVQLDQAGWPVEVVARGPHLSAIRADGLTRHAPDGTVTSHLVAHASIDEAAVNDQDLVVVATKSQQAEVVLDDLLTVAGPGVPVACATNGVQTEHLALRRFDHVLGVLVNVPGVHLVPGEVEVHASTPRGVLDVGRYPVGRSAPADALCDAFTRAGFLSEVVEDIMARKWSKLLGNIGNVCHVLCGPNPDGWRRLYARLRDEADLVVAAAGILVDAEPQRARADLVARGDIEGRPRPGGSTWQSATRGTGNLETVALNGEITLRGRECGVPTPANALVQVEALRLVGQGRAVGSWTETALLDLLDQ